jgi:transcriptional regulator with XRE-family HTH domain
MLLHGNLVGVERSRTPVGSISGRLKIAMQNKGYVVDVGGGRAPEGELRAAHLADELTLDASVVHNYLKGKRDTGDIALALAVLRDMADALGVSFEWLALGRGSMAPTNYLPEQVRQFVQSEVDARVRQAIQEAPQQRPPTNPPPSRTVGSQRPRRS